MHAHDSSICILLTFNIVISMKLYWNYTFSEYSLIQSNSFSKNMVDYRVKFGRLTGCSLVLVHYINPRRPWASRGVIVVLLYWYWEIVAD